MPAYMAMEKSDVNILFDKCSKMSARERRKLTAALQAEGIGIVRIECYAYPDAPGIKHVFFYFQGSREPVPYFMLDEALLAKIREIIAG